MSLHTTHTAFLRGVAVPALLALLVASSGSCCAAAPAPVVDDCAAVHSTDRAPAQDPTAPFALPAQPSHDACMTSVAGGPLAIEADGSSLDAVGTPAGTLADARVVVDALVLSTSRSVDAPAVPLFELHSQYLN